MNKSRLAVTIFPVEINGSFADPLESLRTFDIITDNSIYAFNDVIGIKLSFKNNLLKDVNIIIDNCGNPAFILEKKINEIWERVYISDNFGLPFKFFSDTILPSGETYSAEIFIPSNEIRTEKINGIYRLKFNLSEKESSNRLPEKYLYSNEFIIGEEYEL